MAELEIRIRLRYSLADPTAEWTGVLSSGRYAKIRRLVTGLTPEDIESIRNCPAITVKGEQCKNRIRSPWGVPQEACRVHLKSQGGTAIGDAAPLETE